jgi:hypothetical protein
MAVQKGDCPSGTDTILEAMSATAASPGIVILAVVTGAANGTAATTVTRATCSPGISTSRVDTSVGRSILTTERYDTQRLDALIMGTAAYAVRPAALVNRNRVF